MVKDKKKERKICKSGYEQNYKTMKPFIQKSLYIIGHDCRFAGQSIVQLKLLRPTTKYEK
ncbi:hypothetical protein JHK85_046265 [Glycine max]|uniref:Uncharacterized protein n=1 Tax=Glycine soja TaxID=3848 RepID=A0A0B2SAH1_GLYSO|nr:hypothetical protein JHK87_045463 [Glycine soja]KAG4952398.1 hypothetical protein JHK85_046265 [Glycine max]KHN41274.1 hypothetical protein glysoja_030112 [Glycine soja]